MKMIGISPRFASLCAITAIMAGSSLSAAETGKAELTGVKGSVKVDGQAAFVGEAIKTGQKIETGAGAQANLYLADNGPTVVVLPDSSISFDELSVDKSGAEPVITTKINLKGGTVAGYVKKTSSQSSYIVKGSTVTAVIRSSEYQVTDNGIVAVWSGCVTVSYRGASYEVCGGQMFDPAAASVVANTLSRPAGASSAVRQSANVSLSLPVLSLRPEPPPGNYIATVVITKDVFIDGAPVLKAGQVLTKAALDKLVVEIGSNKFYSEVVKTDVKVDFLVSSEVRIDINGIPTPVLKAGQVLTKIEYDQAIVKYGVDKITGNVKENVVVLTAGQVLTKLELSQAIAKFGDKIVTDPLIAPVPVPVGGLLVVVEIPNSKYQKGDIIDQATFNKLFAENPLREDVKVDKVEPAFVVGPEGIVPKKPELVTSPIKP